MTPLALSRIHFPVTTLGPGRRLGIWFQGCSIRCPGCVSADTWALGRGLTTAEEVAAAVGSWLAGADGITISGGEPFDQPDALVALLAGLRCQTSADILVYSGHPFEALSGVLARAVGLIDALITDPYVDAAPHTLALRGSDNQRLHLLTELGESRMGAYERAPGPHDRRFDIMFGREGEIWLAGIPARGDLARLRALLAADGHSATFSEAPLSRTRNA